MQWEYCSIQGFEQSGSQYTSQQGGYSSPGRERTFVKWALGIDPVPGEATEGTTENITYVVTYFFYRVHGLEDHALYEGDDFAKADEETSRYVAILGMYGWGAIHIILLDNELDHWYFKRKIDPSNQYITF